MQGKITNLPDEDHVLRHVPWNRLRRDENDRVLGPLPQAFALRAGEELLSVNWVEYFSNPDSRLRDTIWAMRKIRTPGGKSAFAKGNVGQIKRTCLAHGTSVRIVREPSAQNPSHAGIRRLPRDDLVLLAALAEEAFTDMIRNADIPAEPEA